MSIEMTASEDILAKLIAFPTVSKDSNTDLIDFISNYLADYGIDSTLTANDENTKFNLHAIIGPHKPGGVMLSGHTDVVPVEGQVWEVDPFRMTRHEDRLYGRGATDMKSFIACVLAIVPKAVALGLKEPIHLAFSYDEEIGCIGVRRMLKMLEIDQPRPDFCIVGEPTSMKIGIAHKGKIGMICRCHGASAHSALTAKGLNAIYLAVDMISEIRKLHSELSASGVQPGFLVPHSTLHVGTIHGGTALNIIPNYCEFKFEIRNLEADNAEAMLNRLHGAARRIADQYREQFDTADIQIEIFNQYPALETPNDAEIVDFVSTLLGHNDITKVDFGTEAGMINNRLSIPTVICGPGSMAQGHKADEFILRSELVRCDDFLTRLVHQLSR